jgi:hypothetical protein
MPCCAPNLYESVLFVGWLPDAKSFGKMVGAPRFELGTSWSRMLKWITAPIRSNRVLTCIHTGMGLSIAQVRLSCYLLLDGTFESGYVINHVIKTAARLP